MVGDGIAMHCIGIVEENRKLCENTFEMVIECPDIAKKAEPGQFLHIKVRDGIDPLLRRPLSLSRIFRDSGHVSLVYRVIGRGTRALTFLEKGEEIDILGPLGKGFPIFRDKRCAAVGGGMGVAPLLELVCRIPGCDSYLGFRSDTFKLEEFKSFCKNVFVATEDGSSGSKGYITDILEDVGKYDIIYTCGPKPMMKKVKELCEINNVKCYVSLEERMGCGIGACLVCACRIREGDRWHYRKVCTDGPVFEAGEVDFDA